MACCPRCGEPLVSTFERAHYEFVCVACEPQTWWEFLQPVGKPETPELQARHDDLRAQYLVEREARRAAKA